MEIQYDDSRLGFITDWNGEHSIFTQKGEPILKQSEQCFHYTTLESFWKIIESETFRATHVRFSNDMEEYRVGENIIQGIIGGNNIQNKNYYVICFCSEGDLLSQWREYGKVGVSIEMDFSRASLFSILEGTRLEKGELQYAMPIEVLYNKKNDLINDSINLPISRLIKYFYEEYDDNFGKDQMMKLVPYIKNSAFKEEREARLLFCLPINKEKETVCYADAITYKKPYLNIKYGDIDEQRRGCSYVDVEDEDGQLIPIVKNAVNEFFSKNMNAVKVFYNKKKNVINKYYGNMSPEMQCDASANSNNIFISAGSNQEELFHAIEEACGLLEKKTKIWCDGHWPMRSIKVGPTLDKEIIKESIDHYCKTHYWMKYVDVSATDTPYREKRYN